MSDEKQKESGSSTSGRGFTPRSGPGSHDGNNMARNVPSTGRSLNRRPPLKALDYTIDHSWDGQPAEHDPYKIHMQWHFEKRTAQRKPHKRAIKVTMEGPLMDEPEAPNELAGYCPNLWDYEVFEMFFANKNDQYLEIEVGPHGHWLVYLLDGKRNVFNKGEELELNVENTFQGSNWRCVFEIPMGFFPPNINRFNAYAISGYPDNRKYSALYPVTDGSETEPDFHRLQYFKSIPLNQAMPPGINDRVYVDDEYGDLWGKIVDKPSNTS